MRGIRHRHGLHCQAVVVAAALLLSATSADAFGTCKQPGLSVSGANNETIDVCSAVADVLDYFRKGGISTELELTIRFQRTVHVEAVNLLDGSRRPYSVSGVYRADRREIQMVELALAPDLRETPLEASLGSTDRRFDPAPRSHPCRD